MGRSQRRGPLGGRTVSQEESAATILPTAAEVEAAVAVASGRSKASLLLTGGRLVNVFTNEIHAAEVQLAGRLIAGIYDPEDGEGPARRDNAVEVRDLHGAFVVPGLIDGHVHLESSLVSPAEYARGVLGRGVTGAVCDPHEIANVAGEEGVRWLLGATDALPFDVWVTVPSCVPSSPFETVGAAFGASEMERLMRHPRVVGVAELMSYPDVVAGDSATLAKARLGEERALTVEGHAPGLAGGALQAYIASGVGSDHEATVLEEGLEKLRAGMFLLIREGSVTRDLDALMPLVHERHADRVGFVTDDRLPHDLLAEGALDLMVRRAVEAGVNPAYAVRCASLNVALHYRLPRRGAVAAGYFADLAVVPDLKKFAPTVVLKDGELVAENGVVRPDLLPAAEEQLGGILLRTVMLPALSGESFRLPSPGGAVRCVVALPNSIVTAQTTVQPTVVQGNVVADPERDLLKLACVERHGRNGNVAVGLVRGFGLRSGALATSVGHDHHNLMVVGASDADMLTAVRRLETLGGGFVAVEEGRVLAELPLPLGGLMTNGSLSDTKLALDALDAAAVGLGCSLPSPYMALSFLGLAVVPELRLTDMGLVDVNLGRLVPLAADA